MAYVASQTHCKKLSLMLMMMIVDEVKEKIEAGPLTL